MSVEFWLVFWSCVFAAGFGGFLIWMRLVAS